MSSTLARSKECRCKDTTFVRIFQVFESYPNRFHGCKNVVKFRFSNDRNVPSLGTVNYDIKAACQFKYLDSSQGTKQIKCCYWH